MSIGLSSGARLGSHSNPYLGAGNVTFFLSFRIRLRKVARLLLNIVHRLQSVAYRDLAGVRLRFKMRPQLTSPIGFNMAIQWLT
jgi:hypothetical protein